ncbi:asparagine--tRNA ligase [Ketobacter sp. MCCC 1A13808]|uniref:asparagine--tRNA ligase n=1 Tax=Ketobacter sp. MCCC 1A13808 TaxID=2602738 RepID=UPI000F20006B|nr:asparagine--tRNA ligase [Ketobacter sp. MCCC 1A13808]MVF10821.1 asparagine--tRNA ligase [Ketobacter sp. MCCC 1A13808]RLP56225.1 MAG: asparagine--tRNA ligase [Ketobacter sp.]
MDWPLQISDYLAAKAPLGSQVSIRGWVRTRRDSKAGFSFINVHDGSAFDGIQVVADQSLPNYQDDVLKLSAGCSVEVSGELVKSAGKEQAVELQAQAISVLGWVDDPETYPVAKKRHSFEYLRTVAHLRPRTNTFGAVARVRNSAYQAIHRYFSERSFNWVNTPIITASDCEGAGEMFRVSTLDLLQVPRNDKGEIDFSRDFFADEAFLTVSGQLNGEAFCTALSRIYTFGPTFRAENSHTSRHLAEFWMVEPEVAFANLQDNADMAEEFLQTIFKAVLNECGDDMAFFAQHVNADAITRLQSIVDSEFVRMDYSEAITILEKCGKQFEFPLHWGVDLQSEHERYLAEEHVGRPVILMNYPKSIKAFYMRANDDDKTCAAMDVLAPGIGEIIGGSQREERLDLLDEKMDALGLKEDLWWYRDLRRYGTVPHAGFGLGFERLLNYITGLDNVRDVIPFPRVPGSALF